MPSVQDVGSSKPACRLTIRLIHSGRLASRISWKMTAPWKPLGGSLATPTAGPRNFTIAAYRRFCSRIWKGFDTNFEARRKVTKCREIKFLSVTAMRIQNGGKTSRCTSNRTCVAVLSSLGRTNKLFLVQRGLEKSNQHYFKRTSLFYWLPLLFWPQTSSMSMNSVHY